MTKQAKEPEEKKKTVLDRKTVEIINYSSTPYDDVYRTMINDCPSLIIPVVNEVFGKHHRAEEEITVMNNEFFLNRQNGSQLERITDSNFQIEGERYHIECQSTPDGSMLIRIFEYDTQIALSDALLENNILEVPFPQTAILYLRHTEQTPDEMTIRILVPGGYCSYPVPIMKAQRYSLEEIFEKKLYFLIPFYIFVYEKDLEEYNTKEEKLEQLQRVYQDLMTRLQEAVAVKQINEMIRQLIISMSQKVIVHISRKYEKVVERLGGIMGGNILDYEAKDIYQSGIKEGFKQGREEGKIQSLLDIITKKLSKGKTIPKIADEIEESEETVRQLMKEHNLER